MPEMATVYGMQSTISYTRAGEEQDQRELDGMDRAAKAGDSQAMRKILEHYTTRVLFGKNAIR